MTTPNDARTDAEKALLAQILYKVAVARTDMVNKRDRDAQMLVEQDAPAILKASAGAYYLGAIGAYDAVLGGLRGAWDQIAVDDALTKLEAIHGEARAQ